MSNFNIDLPYFDFLLQEFNQGNMEAENALGRNVHWGYWENPKLAEKTVADFQIATEKLTQLICDFANIKDGMKILDVGCGFGGTIASLNERFSNLQLVGINIDNRQLERARKLVLPQHNNQIEFICASASELPLDDNYFDVVLAVECIFHFPSRHDFFKEANRVLKPQGKFALSDFILSGKNIFNIPILDSLVSMIIAQFYGKSSACLMTDYEKLAVNNQFKLIKEQDITKETLPTYDILMSLFNQFKLDYWQANLSTQLLKMAQASQIITYQVLGYEKI